MEPQRDSPRDSPVPRAAARAAPEPSTAGERWLLLLVLLVALPLRLGDFTEPWTGKGWQGIGALIATEARNYVDHGWWTLRFAPVLDVASSPRGGHWDFYMHHPAGLALMISMSFKLFGVAEWSARLVPIALSLLELAAIWAVTRRMFGRGAALAAAALCATLPATAFYGSHVDDIGPALMGFVALAFALHLRQLDRPSRACFAGQLLALAAACAVNWQGLEVAGMLALHCVLLRRWREAAWLLGLAALAPLVQLLHIRWAMGGLSEPGRWGTLFEAFAWRSWGGVEQFGGGHGSAWKLGENILRLYTAPALALAAVGLLALRRARWRWALAAMAVFALVDMLIFLEGSARHEYWCTTLATVLLPLAGAGVAVLAGWLASRAGRRAAAAAGALVVLAAGVHGARLTHERFEVIEDTTHRDLGLLIRDSTGPDDTVWTCELLTYTFTYYAQRWMHGEMRDDHLVRLREGLPEEAGNWFVLPEQPLAPHDHDVLLKVLQRNYPERVLRTAGGAVVHVFDLSRKI